MVSALSLLLLARTNNGNMVPLAVVSAWADAAEPANKKRRDGSAVAGAASIEGRCHLLLVALLVVIAVNMGLLLLWEGVFPAAVAYVSTVPRMLEKVSVDVDISGLRYTRPFREQVSLRATGAVSQHPEKPIPRQYLSPVSVAGPVHPAL